MAIGITWRIQYYSGLNTLTDLTSKVRRFNVEFDAPLARAGRSRATIVFNNNDGAFTPNGTGTYANVDWFKYCFVIENKAPNYDNAYRTTFAGVVSDVTVDIQSKKESTVTLTLVDILTVAGRSQATTNYASTITVDTVDLALERMVNGYSSGGTVYYSGVAMPYLAQTGAATIDGLPFTDMLTTVSNDDFPAGRVGDWINNNLLTTGPSAAFCDGVDYDATTTGLVFSYLVVDYPLNNAIGTGGVTTFADGSSALTSGQLPYSDFDLAYNFDSLVNTCTAQDQRDVYTLTTVTDTTSTANYGVRTVEFSSTCTEQQADVNRVANFWPNRYSTPRFTVRSISTSLSTVRAHAVDNGIAERNFHYLLTPGLGLWQRLAVIYTAPGITTRRTDQLVTSKTRIQVSPADTKVTFELVPGADNQSFEVGSTTYGVVGTNKVA